MKKHIDNYANDRENYIKNFYLENELNKLYKGHCAFNMEYIPADDYKITTHKWYGLYEENIKLLSDTIGDLYHKINQLNHKIEEQNIQIKRLRNKKNLYSEELNIVKSIIFNKINDYNCGLFNTINNAGDKLELLFEGKYIKLYGCYFYSYYEVFGLKDKDFNEIKKKYIKKTGCK